MSDKSLRDRGGTGISFGGGEKPALRRKLAQHTDITGIERTFNKDEFIVSKTNLLGHITYANEVFLRMASMTEAETLGAPHSVIRHPEMPRCVFKLLWETIAAGNEIFAYVINLAKTGDHYWVFAHVTPSFDSGGKIIGYHSNRRVADPVALEKIKSLYADLREIEQASGNPKENMNQAGAYLENLLKEAGISYDEFIFSL